MITITDDVLYSLVFIIVISRFLNYRKPLFGYKLEVSYEFDGYADKIYFFLFVKVYSKTIKLE